MLCVVYNLHNQIIVEKTAANAGKQSEILKCKSTKSTFQLKSQMIQEKKLLSTYLSAKIQKVLLS